MLHVMNRAAWTAVCATCVALAAGCVSEQPPGGLGTPQGYGEPVNGFPNWFERNIYALTNRARSDPAADLASCNYCPDADCFTGPVRPVEWMEDLNRAARFHADSLAASGCSMAHRSPCTLADDVGSTYPSGCDGSVSCACSGGKTCGSGTSMGSRITLFGRPGFKAENVAGASDPFSVFYAWMHEPVGDGTCAWSSSNGHRWNILGANWTHLGVGWNGSYTVQDFWNDGNNFDLPVSHVLDGVHYPETGTSFAFRATWHHTGGAPATAHVNVDGVCHAMALERGLDTFGTWLAQVDTGRGCHEYYFRFTDAVGTLFTYPASGSYGISCSSDWSSTRPTEAVGCPDTCEPSCDGKSCGDDGCGGSCGPCGTNESCVSGSCVCAPDCDGKDCGSNGCGGSCGSCGTNQTCNAGQCECAPNCSGKQCGSNGCSGSCGSCATNETCDAGTCVCVPNCDGKQCGPNGCGGNCGGCQPGEACESGTCVGCTPSCGGKECGPDGCGGSCGPCAESETCISGSCVGCTPSCGPNKCGPNGCGGVCGTCESNEICSGGQCECVPACDGKNCGPNGCGGACGTCDAGESCNGGVCTCVPDCGGKECGDDGCGGTCADCASNESCVSATCVCVPDCGTATCGDDGCGGACGRCESNEICVAGECLCDTDCGDADGGPSGGDSMPSDDGGPTGGDDDTPPPGDIDRIAPLTGIDDSSASPPGAPAPEPDPVISPLTGGCSTSGASTVLPLGALLLLLGLRRRRE